MAESSDVKTVMLTPELYERARRLAEAEGISVEQAVADAIGVAWVRYAGKRKLKPEAW